MGIRVYRPLIFRPPSPTMGGRGIMFYGRPSGCPSVDRPLTPISRFNETCHKYY